MLSFVTLAERPDLVDAVWAMPNPWPAAELTRARAAPVL
jgi:hypothetical protein